MIKPECELGYTNDQLNEIIADMDQFNAWMVGQTRAICQGRKFNHDTRQYEVACNGVAHGEITYRADVERYLANAWIVD